MRAIPDGSPPSLLLRMLGRNDSQPALFQMVDLEAVVPADHRLRQLDAVLDLSFVREAVASCYSPGRGRPSIDPELVIRMLVSGMLYNFSDRELCEEIGMPVGCAGSAGSTCTIRCRTTRHSAS